MKKLSVLALLCFFMCSGICIAAPYQFEDLIDDWTILGFDSDVAVIVQGCPLTYQHDINDDVDFLAGDSVLEAFLELDFTNDSSDAYGWFILPYDFREYASYVIAEDGTINNLGEVDNENISGLILDIDWLNDDGLLDVTITVSNPLGTAFASLDHSRLYGTAEAAPVPEPATLFLLGSGLVGLAGFRRRKS